MKKTLLFIIAFLLIGVGIFFFYTKNQNVYPQKNNTSLKFEPGIYYRTPNLKDPSGILSHIGSNLASNTKMSPVDFDINTDNVIYSTDDMLFLVSVDGNTREVKVKGLYQMARPSLSPDGTMATVQATEKRPERNETINPNKLDIYVVSLKDGKFINISHDSLPSESPTWFNQSNKIAYSTFSASEGVDIHIYDLDQQKEVLQIENEGWLHLAVSKDDSTILVPKTMKLFDSRTGIKKGNLKSKVLEGLKKAGFALDTEHSGDMLSSFPMDGDFSPNGQEVLFDGGVMQNGISGAIIARIRLDGKNFTVIAGFMEINPAFTNNNNFSQLNPMWF